MNNQTILIIAIVVSTVLMGVNSGILVTLIMQKYNKESSKKSLSKSPDSEPEPHIVTDKEVNDFIDVRKQDRSTDKIIKSNTNIYEPRMTKRKGSDK